MPSQRMALPRFHVSAFEFPNFSLCDIIRPVTLRSLCIQRFVFWVVSVGASESTKRAVVSVWRGQCQVLAFECRSSRRSWVSVC